MTIHIKKWGNSASVRIPASVMAAAHLQMDQAVEVHEEDGNIIIKPIVAPVPVYDLDTLLAGITDENAHDEIDFGPPVGQEIW